MRKATWHQGPTQPSAAAPSPRACRAPALQSVVNVLPKEASLSSAKGAAATCLDYCGEDKEDGSFHQFHTHQIQLGSPRKETEAPLCQVVCNSFSMCDKIDPLWQTTRWLRSFKEQCEEDEPICWPLVCPLTDGSDTAMLALAQWLMAAWKWAITISTPHICLPAPKVMNIGLFLNEDTTGYRWSVQQWLEAYTRVLQHVGEAAEGRRWRPEGEGFTPKVSPLVEAFISMKGAWDAENCAMCCWSKPLGDVPCQRDKSAHANVISYLDELAMCQPSRKACDKLVWPPSICSPHATPG